VMWLSPSALSEQVTGAGAGSGAGAGRAGEHEAWLVMFAADWASSCAHLDPTFAELSTHFTSPVGGMGGRPR